MIYNQYHKNQNMYKILWCAVLIMMAGFVLIRSLDGFGNFGYKWNGSYNDGDAQTPWKVINFLNVTFSSPSPATVLFYTSIDIGIILLVHGMKGYNKWICIFGNTSLFFYVIHLIIVVILDDIWHAIDIKYDETSAIPLFATYIVWIIVIIIMCPLCNFYKKFKQSRDYRSIWRMF